MRKYIPIVLLLLAMIAAYYFGFHKYFTFESLKEHRHFLKKMVDQHWLATSLIFLLTYITLTALSLPIDAFFCLTAGFLFPQPFCTLYIIFGAALGGSILFYAAKTAFADLFRRKAGPRLKKLEHNFHHNAACYIIFLRLIPVLPTWIVNVAPALFNVPYRTFLWATIVGYIPGAYVFSEAGKGLGKFLDRWFKPRYTELFDTEFYIGLGVMVLLALGMLLFMRYLSKRKNKP